MIFNEQGNISVIGSALFIGAPSGIYISTNNGVNWVQKNEGFQWAVPKNQKFIQSGNYVLMGSNQSVWKRPVCELIGLQQISEEIPNDYFMSQNYPNPFNPNSKISFKIKKSGPVKLSLFDITGKEVQVIINSELKPGIYEIDINSENLSSGVYFYMLKAVNFSDTKKLIILK